MEAESARLAKQRLDEFMIGFSTINKKLKEVFRMLTIQGQAELELVDSMDPFSDVRHSNCFFPFAAGLHVWHLD